MLVETRSLGGQGLSYLVVVAQLAERQVVVLEVGGSSPLGHPHANEPGQAANPLGG